MQSEKIGPPKVADEDNWPASRGYGRMVRCHQCKYWSDWKLVCEKGAIEGLPVLGELECWWCYIQRTDTNLTKANVTPLFKRLLGKERTDRVERYQNLLAYITFPEDEGSSKEKLSGRKRAFDIANAERIAFTASGGGSSSIDPLDTDEDVTFRQGDQYVGINDVVYEGDQECILFNWASKTSKGKNTAMATLVDKETRETITMGRSLEGDIASHNLCVISDPRAIWLMQQQFDPDRKKYCAFAIGGEYRDPTDPRGNTKHYDGIHVMGLSKHRYKSGGPGNLWSALAWTRLVPLLKGDHAGIVEGRSKCKRQLDNLGIAEFDGQSALTYFQEQFFVYARANPKESGYRTVQVCQYVCGCIRDYVHRSKQIGSPSNKAG